MLLVFVICSPSLLSLWSVVDRRHVLQFLFHALPPGFRLDQFCPWPKPAQQFKDDRLIFLPKRHEHLIAGALFKSGMPILPVALEPLRLRSREAKDDGCFALPLLHRRSQPRVPQRLLDVKRT